MTSIFDGYALRGVTLRNRIGVSPMCEYSSENGMPGDRIQPAASTHALAGR